MMYKIIPTQQFQKDVEHYVKKHKYRHIAQDIKSVTDELEKGNLIGDELSGLNIKSDGHVYKVRVVNTDAKIGKSNGYRIIYYAIKDDAEIYLLAIYSKKDDKNVPSDKEIAGLVEKYCL